MLTLGVTGGSGCGKTTLLAVWASLGCVAIDADSLYHKLLIQDAELLAQIQTVFPHAFTNGVLDRKQLGQTVFADKAALARLEAVTHPAVVSAIRRQIDRAQTGGADAVAIDAIRLLESPLTVVCDAVIAITAPMKDRLARIMARDGVDETYARARIAAQPDNDFYRKNAHILLENRGDPTQFAQQCANLYDQLLYNQKK